MINYIQVCEYATELGATISEGINWTWANHFSKREHAEQFIRAFPEMETRGIYDGNPGFSVRFR